MGCCPSKGDELSGRPGASIEDVEDKIFLLLKDNFCASGREAQLFGGVLKEQSILKLQDKVKTINATEQELRDQEPADYFINKVALVDPDAGEIVITYDRVMEVCSRFDIDELHMLYERLRHVKVNRLREAHGTDIISIIDVEGQSQYSECRGNARKKANDGRNVTREDIDTSSVNSEFNVRTLGLG